LVDRSLIYWRETSQGARYFLHELTRQYAAERLARSPETAGAVEAAHRRYYAAEMAALSPALSGPAPQHAYATIHREIDNVRRAWLSAVQELDLESLGRLLEPLTQLYYRQGWFAEGQERL